MNVLAIVIPYYKLAFFEATLRSLKTQTDQRFKVYIGDDASPEDCSFLLKKFEGEFTVHYHRFENNLGRKCLAMQWERCIALSANEEWVMILGDDDVLGDNVVEGFYREFEKFNRLSNVVRYATIVLNEQNDSQSVKFVNPEFEDGLDSAVRKLRGGARSSLSEYFFTRASYLKFGFIQYPCGFYSDDRAWVDFSDTKPIYSINESIVYIRISDYSISGGNNIVNLNKARVEFLTYLCDHRLKFLSKRNKGFMLQQMENALRKSNCKDYGLWVRLYFRCLFKLDRKELFKFHKRIFKVIQIKFIN